MPRVHLLASVQDPNNPETIFGKGHYMDVDDAWATQLNNEGKAEILAPVEPPPEPQPQSRT